jgi:secreted PhoX family phosphatase
MHHDGIHFFSQDGSQSGLLVMNHEYTDDGLLHPDGMKTWSAEKVRKAQAAHGVSVIEVAQKDGRWQVVRPSPWARRITASTPMALSGPAAGHALMKTAADPSGRRVLGTLNNCASGITPWGTYLTCEENFIFYFKGPDEPDAHQRAGACARATRWATAGTSTTSASTPPGTRTNRTASAGWSRSTPTTRADGAGQAHALGRAAHEGATVA